MSRSVFGRQGEIGKLQEHLSTGKQINRPSDDASGFAIARTLDASIRRYDQYVRTINSSRLWVDQTQDALANMSDQFTSAYEEGIRAINATLGPAELEAIAQEIESLMTVVVDDLNRKAGSEYVFAGGKTGSTPFVDDGSATSDAAGITYYGDARSRQRTISDDLDIGINLDGSRVVGLASGGTITEALNELATAIRSGDTAAIEAGLTRTTEARDHLLAMTAAVGGVSERMQIAEEQLQSSLLLAESRRSRIEDTNLAFTLAELQKQQIGLQAAGQALAVMRQLDLTNFLF